MKQFLYIAVAVVTMLSAMGVSAQTIALGEKTPPIKKAKWLNGNKPQKCNFTYIEFIHSGSLSCRQSAERIYKSVKAREDMSFILISHQSATEIDEWVMHHIGERSGVVVDDTNIRTSFGVNYAPYAVILDHKHRALWFGNPQLLHHEMIEGIINNNQKRNKQ